MLGGFHPGDLRTNTTLPLDTPRWLPLARPLNRTIHLIGYPRLILGYGYPINETAFRSFRPTESRLLTVTPAHGSRNQNTVTTVLGEYLAQSTQKERNMPFIQFLRRLLVLALFTVSPITQAGQHVSITAADGTELMATYTAAENPGPGMLLIHQCNMDRSMWVDITAALVESGIHVLTMDLRGFGETPGAGLRGEGGFPAFLETASRDVDLAYQYLTQQPGVDGTHIGMGGASCGAMLTATLASQKAGVDALVLLSGPPSGGAVAHMVATPELAVFAAAATGDPITPGVAERLQGAVDGSGNAASTAMIYPGTEHGYPMFAANPDLQPALVRWIKAQLLEPGGNND